MKNGYRRLLPGIFLGLIVAAVVFHFARGGASLYGDDAKGQPVPAVLRQNIRSAAEAFPVSAQRSAAALDHRQLAASLEGTDIDGKLRVDAEGNLVVDQAVRDFFDYILNAVGEATPEEAIDFIRRYAQSRLPAAAAQQAVDLLNDYIAFKHRATELMSEPLQPGGEQTPDYYLATLEQTFDRLYHLRRQHMSAADADAFFGLEEAYAGYSLAKARIQFAEELTMEERQGRVEEARRQLPESLNESFQRLEDNGEREEAIRNALAEAASLEEKRIALYEHHDVETADRIIDHIEEEKRREENFSDYLQAKAELCASGWGEEEHARRLGALKKRFFPTAQERNIAEMNEARLARKGGGGSC